MKKYFLFAVFVFFIANMAFGQISNKPFAAPEKSVWVTPQLDTITVYKIIDINFEMETGRWTVTYTDHYGYQPRPDSIGKDGNVFAFPSGYLPFVGYVSEEMVKEITADSKAVDGVRLNSKNELEIVWHYHLPEPKPVNPMSAPNERPAYPQPPVVANNACNNNYYYSQDTATANTIMLCYDLEAHQWFIPLAGQMDKAHRLYIDQAMVDALTIKQPDRSKRPNGKNK